MSHRPVHIYLFFIYKLVFLFLLHIAASSLSKGILLIGCLISISLRRSVSYFSAEWVDSPVHHRMLYPQSTAFICPSHPCSLSLLLSLSFCFHTALSVSEIWLCLFLPVLVLNLTLFQRLCHGFGFWVRCFLFYFEVFPSPCVPLYFLPLFFSRRFSLFWLVKPVPP